MTLFQGPKGHNCTHKTMKTMKTEEGGKRGSRSHFTGNKLVFLQFTKNKKKNNSDSMKITVHDEMRIFLAFHGK